MDKIKLADVKDDFLLMCKKKDEFSIYNFINNDVEKALYIGYLLVSDKELTIPITVRKELRHILDGMDKYNPQLEWYKTKFSNDTPYETFVESALENLFFDSHMEKIKLALIFGAHLYESSRDIH